MASSYAAVQEDQAPAVQVPTEQTVSHLSEVQGDASDHDLLKEIRQQRADLPEWLLAKLKDTLQSNRSRIQVLTARNLRLEAMHNEKPSTDQAIAVQLQPKSFEGAKLGRRFKVRHSRSHTPRICGICKLCLANRIAELSAVRAATLHLLHGASLCGPVSPPIYP